MKRRVVADFVCWPVELVMAVVFGRYYAHVPREVVELSMDQERVFEAMTEAHEVAGGDAAAFWRHHLEAQRALTAFLRSCRSLT